MKVDLGWSVTGKGAACLEHVLLARLVVMTSKQGKNQSYDAVIGEISKDFDA